MPTLLKSRCPHCQATVKVNDTLVGKRVRCPACKQPFEVDSVEIAGTTSASLDLLPPARQTMEAAASDTAENSAGSRGKGQCAAPKLGRLGRFELKEVLGQGAFGRVYRAYDPQLDRFVALKVPTFGPEEMHKVQRFLAEAKAAARLRHPNIVPTYESGQIDGQYYIAAQYVAGRPLSKRIKDNPPDFRQAAELVRQLADALAYAHSEGIVHRDIKPDNIMLDSKGIPQIMDFGLAKRVNEDSGMTTDGSILGTPAYMSPEQARGELSQVGAHSDQYSLGVVLYELLTGKRPFEGPAHVVIAQVVHVEPPSPRSVCPVIPCDLEAICQVALNKHQTQRYAGCAMFSTDLARWLGGLDTVARPIGLTERAARWGRRNPVVAGLLATSAALLTAVAVVSTLAYVRAASDAIAKTELATKNAKLAETERKARDEAEQNATVARQQSELALKSLESVIFDIERGLANVPGAGEVRRKLLLTALAQLEEVSDQFTSRSAIDRNAHVALIQIGDVFMQIGSGTPGGADADGHWTAARKVYQQAFDIAQKLSADPNDVQAQRDLSNSYDRLGDVGREAGQVQEALRNFQKGLEIRQKLAAADPSDFQDQHGLSVSYTRLVDVYLRSGQVTEALGSCQKGLEISQKLAAADPSDSEAQRDLSVSYDKLGDVQLHSRQVTEAIGSYQKGMEIRQKLAAADPSDSEAQRDLAVSYNHLGDVRLHSRQVTEALGSYQKGMEICQKLAAADPSDVQAQVDLYSCHHRIGAVKQKQNQYEEAIESYGRGLKVLQALKEQKRLSPENEEWIGIAEQAIVECRKIQGDPSR